MRVLLACGGTGGHIYPAVAVAQWFKAHERGAEILFVGAEGAMETKLVPAEGFQLRTVRVSSLAHNMSLKALRRNAKAMAQLLGSMRGAGKIIKEFRPDIVIGTGGYVCFPVVYEARSRRIPALLHESNARPGLTTRILARRVDRVMTGFAGLEGQYPRPERVVFTGTPVREAFLLADRDRARRELGLDERPVVVSAFGSLGARDMNRVMAGVLEHAAQSGQWQMLHAAGTRYYETLTETLKERGAGDKANIRIYEYISDMPRVMAAADAFIGRAGASTLTELMVTGTPAVLIPSPNVTGDHQTANAQKLREQCGVEVLPEAGLTPERLLEALEGWLGDPERLKRTRAALMKASAPDAAQRIYDLAKEVVR